MARIREIAAEDVDLNANDVDAASRMLAGAARSMASKWWSAPWHTANA